MSELIQIEKIAQVKQGRYTSPSELSATPTEQSKVPVWGANGILGYTQNATYEQAQPLVTCRGNGCGLIQWSGGRAHISNNAMAILLKEECRESSRYLYYSLLCSDFSDVTTGSAQPQITMGHLNKKEIFWHLEPRERAEIAHILSTLDDKIELNRKTNETLEAMAKVLFKSWFVDFDPVRAKAEGRPTRLPAEISDLFPDSFEDSELGEIPRGWEVAQLGDVLDVDKGVSYKGDFLSDSEGLPMVNLGCFAGGGAFRQEKMKFYAGEHRERHIAQAGDLLIANTDMTQNRIILGAPIIIPPWKGKEKFLFSHHTFAVRFKQREDALKWYVYFTLLKPSFRQIAAGHATGTTVLALPKDGITDYQAVIPPSDLLKEFAERADELFLKCQKADEQNDLLAHLRDTLLPKLISGEIRIPDAEKLLEEVGV
jgi:type I restriction enzyme S subunit